MRITTLKFERYIMQSIQSRVEKTSEHCRDNQTPGRYFKLGNKLISWRVEYIIVTDQIQRTLYCKSIRTQPRSRILSTGRSLLTLFHKQSVCNSINSINIIIIAYGKVVITCSYSVGTRMPSAPSPPPYPPPKKKPPHWALAGNLEIISLIFSLTIVE